MKSASLRQGASYWYAWFDEEAAKVSVDRCVCRTVRKDRAYLTEVIDGVTWGKRSKKTGDYGWLDPIPTWARSMVVQGSESARRYATTKAAAIRAAIATERKNREHYKGSAEIVAECDVVIAALTKRLQRTKD